MVAATLDAQKLTLTVLDVEEETASASTLGEFRAGKPLVLDFWHTRCVKCPAAMAMLDAHAKAHPEIVFAACALSLGSDTEGTQEQVLELLQDQYEELKHLYMTFDEKEAAKKQLGFSAVPFCVVFNAEGAIVYKGEPKGIDYATVFDAAPVAAAPADPAADKEQQGAAISAGLAKVAIADEAEAPATKPLGESNRAGVVFGFGNDDEDF